MKDFFKKTYELIDELKNNQSDEKMKELEILWRSNIVSVKNPQINILLHNPKEKALLTQSLLHYFLEEDEKMATVYFSELQPSLSYKERTFLKNFIKNYKSIKEIKEEIKNNKFTKLDKFLKSNPFFKEKLDLEYETNKLKFYNLFKTDKKEAILFLRKEMNKFILHEMYREDLRNFLLTMLESNGLDLNDRVINILNRDSSLVYDMPIRSFLKELFLSGKKSLPILRDATNTFSDVELKSLLEKETLIRLPLTELYHSVFVCPVLKNACDAFNLPCLLECGHVISQNAITQITKTGNKASFKCPYCPALCSSDKSKLLFVRK
ncbi:protein RMD5 like protein [Tubulinosema ratisbonensis]|uniref:Protein RMD5 like protein n=1 Tax=Tubulinosema ratisbonensis TaxID=291195 RepID=A0A437AIA3_9MICR|nr:protein RMD5 like protein [Tubulinosema ratisbonensis]